MIVYFRTNPSPIDQSLIDRLENDIGSNIEICNSWSSLLITIGSISSVRLSPLLILVDADIMHNKEITIHEIVDMISTMHRCVSYPYKFQMAIVLSEPCTNLFIKTIQGTEILGIVPFAEKYGYEATVDALRRLIQGQHYWPKDISVNHLVDLKQHTQIGIYLTTRQKEVLSLVCNRGLSNKKIATALKISESTVKIHISAILKEYGVRNRTQLALAATSSLKA